MALKKVKVVINGIETLLKLDPESEEYKRLVAEGQIRTTAAATTKKRTARNK